MKRILVLALLCFTTCTLTACQKKTEEKEKEVIEFHDVIPEEVPVVLRDENYVPQTEESEPESESEPETEEAIIPFCDRNEVAYDVKVNTYEDDVFKIEYPEISGMENTDLMGRINTLIQNQIMPEHVMDDDGHLTYEVSCKIATQGTGVLSFVCTGYEEYEGAAHPSRFVMAMNIDMTNGNNIRLKDYADIEAIVSDLELEQGYTLADTPMEKSDFSAFINNGYMTDYALTLMDYDIDSNRAEHVQTGYSYIEDNHPVLCMDVDHASGDYVLVSFDIPIK